jgi:hypothetical protein
MSYVHFNTCYYHWLHSNWIQCLSNWVVIAVILFFHFRRMFLDNVWLIGVNALIANSQALFRHNLNISKTFDRKSLANFSILSIKIHTFCCDAFDPKFEYNITFRLISWSQCLISLLVLHLCIFASYSTTSVLCEQL